MMTNEITTEIIKARNGKYGPFIDNAAVAQRIKEVMHTAPSWKTLPDDMKESLDLIALKIARIVTGYDPSYLDNWDDIAGYAKLITDRIRSPNADLVSA